MTTGDAPLTPAQRARLSEVERRDDGTRIIGWSQHHEGPVLQLPSGALKVLTPRGRRIPVTRERIR